MSAVFHSSDQGSSSSFNNCRSNQCNNWFQAQKNCSRCSPCSHLFWSNSIRELWPEPGCRQLAGWWLAGAIAGHSRHSFELNFAAISPLLLRFNSIFPGLVVAASQISKALRTAQRFSHPDLRRTLIAVLLMVPMIQKQVPPKSSVCSLFSRIILAILRYTWYTPFGQCFLSGQHGWTNTLAVAPMLQALSGLNSETLMNLLMAWYYSGYYTGEYAARQGKMWILWIPWVPWA